MRRPGAPSHSECDQSHRQVRYGEIVASIASKSAGSGTRANIDEFTKTTARTIETVGGADHAKAIIILNPANPQLIKSGPHGQITQTCLWRRSDKLLNARSRASERRASNANPNLRRPHHRRTRPRFEGGRSLNSRLLLLLQALCGAVPVENRGGTASPDARCRCYPTSPSRQPTIHGHSEIARL